MTSMPTVSAAFGCSPTARVRRPQRERNSKIWRTTTNKISDIEIGPWLKNIPNSQPMTGRSVRAVGGVNGENAPALVGELLAMIELR